MEEDVSATLIPEEDRELTMEDVFGRSKEEDMLGDPKVGHAEVTEDPIGGLGFDMVAWKRRCRQRLCRKKVEKDLSKGNETTATGEQTREGRVREDALALSRLVRHLFKSQWTQSCPSTGEQGGARSSPSDLHGLVLHEQKGRARRATILWCWWSIKKLGTKVLGWLRRRDLGVMERWSGWWGTCPRSWSLGDTLAETLEDWFWVRMESGLSKRWGMHWVDTMVDSSSPKLRPAGKANPVDVANKRSNVWLSLSES